jgi:polyisoprenoid-binding protein YceI
MDVERYAIDPGLSRFTVRAFASGMLAAFGHNPTIAIRDFTGEAEFVPGTLEMAALHLRIKAASLEVTDDMGDKDRREIERTMNDQVLESSHFPEIVFDCSNVSASRAGDGQYWVNLVGDLSLHGVTSSQPLAAQVVVNGDTLRAHGEFSVRQTAYGIKPVSFAGGTLKLKDELKCTFDIVAHKQAGAK